MASKADKNAAQAPEGDVMADAKKLLEDLKKKSQVEYMSILKKMNRDISSQRDEAKKESDKMQEEVNTLTAAKNKVKAEHDQIMNQINDLVSLVYNYILDCVVKVTTF